LKEKRKKNLSDLKKIFKKIKAPTILKKKINLLRDYIWIRSKGRDDITLGQWQSMPIFKEISRRLKISINELSWLDYREIVYYLKHNRYFKRNIAKIREMIKERQRGYILFFLEDQEYLLTGEFFKDFIKKEKQTPFASFLQEGWFKKSEMGTKLELKNYFTGRIACPGYAKG